MPLSNARNTYKDFFSSEKKSEFHNKIKYIDLFPGPNGSNAFLSEYDNG